MKILKIFKIPEDDQKLNNQNRVREACRIVLFDENNLMPILFASKENYHKLPWWWIEWKEEKIEALKREAMEETWCKIDSIKEVWIVIEENSSWKQISYCYIWKVIKKWVVNFTKNEIEKWFELQRISIEKATSLIEKDLPTSLGGKRKQKRDYFILKFIEKQLINE